MIILVECLWPKEAGPVFTYGLASGLKMNGHEVYCILSEEMKEQMPWEETFGISHLAYIYQTPRKYKLFSSSISFISDCLKIKKKFRFISFDLAIRTFSHPFDIKVINFTNYKKLAIVCHDPIPHSGMRNHLIKQYQKEIRKADDVIVLTKSFIPVVEKNYEKHLENIHFMRHGLMTYKSHRVNQNTKEHKNQINFLFFGRIESYKGLHVLADAWQTVTEKYTNTYLTIAGSGDYSPYKGKFSHLPNVIVINRYINDNEVSDLFNTGNTVALLPYTDATQSGVIPIAFDYGIPVIASNAGGLKEQLFDGEYGILFESGNSKALADSMALFLQFPLFYASEAMKMRKGRELLQWEYVTKELMDHWNL